MNLVNYQQDTSMNGGSLGKMLTSQKEAKDNKNCYNCRIDNIMLSTTMEILSIKIETAISMITKQKYD